MLTSWRNFELHLLSISFLVQFKVLVIKPYMGWGPIICPCGSGTADNQKGWYASGRFVCRFVILFYLCFYWVAPILIGSPRLWTGVIEPLLSFITGKIQSSCSFNLFLLLVCFEFFFVTLWETEIRLGLDSTYIK